MTSFRFFHAADIHLDSPLKGLAGQEGAAAERIRAAPREAFEQLIGTAIDEKIDLLVIAGDLYDGDWRDYNTGLFFVSQMGRLNEAGIPACVLHGNHDAENRITKSLTLPGNVHVLPARKPATIRLDELGAALHGQSFAQRAETANLARAYPEPVDGAFNIGVLHTALDGRGGHETYAPCTLPDLIGRGYDYWALGHVHRAELVHERPHVVFPGNLQGRHVRETGPKGAVSVTVTDGEVAELEWRYCDVVRWTVIRVDADGCERFVDVVDRMRAAIGDAVADEADGRLLACRVELRGHAPVHEQLLASEASLAAEAEAAALGLGDGTAWIEQVIVATEPVADPEALARREDAVGELRRMLLDAGDDPELIRLLDDTLARLAGQLPAGVRNSTEDSALKAAAAGDYTALIADVAPWLCGRLAGSGD